MGFPSSSGLLQGGRAKGGRLPIQAGSDIFIHLFFQNEQDNLFRHLHINMSVLYQL